MSQVLYRTEPRKSRTWQEFLEDLAGDIQSHAEEMLPEGLRLDCKLSMKDEDHGHLVIQIRDTDDETVSEWFAKLMPRYEVQRGDSLRSYNIVQMCRGDWATDQVQLDDGTDGTFRVEARAHTVLAIAALGV